MPTPDDLTLRVPPTPESLRWVESVIGPGARVDSVRRLRGGDSSAVHSLTVDRAGRTERLVLRRFVRVDWLAVEPDLAAHEATVLRLVATTDAPTPRLIAVDTDGSAAGTPAVLMTYLSGRVLLTPHRIDPWLQRMAGILPIIHALGPTARELPWEYAPYAQPQDVQVPPWTERRNDWEGIITFARGPRPQAAETLIHRDYHPGNILWQNGRITGIVDWVNACRGPAGVDIGHCRRNLAILHGVEVADRFLDHCLDWADYNPYWDILSLLDAELDEPLYQGWLDFGIKLTPALARTRLDEYAASLVARLQAPLS